MNKALSVLLILLFSISFQSCETDPSSKKTSMLYTSGGRTSEVLVVISDELWKGVLGDTLRSLMGGVPEWLAVAEAEYDLHQIPYRIFDNVYQKQRNILFIKKNELEEGKIKFKNNAYAQPQTFIQIQSKTTQDLLKLVVENMPKIKETFHHNDIKRIAEAYKGLEVKSLSNDLAKAFGFSLTLPKGFYIAKRDSNFMWLRRPTTDVEEGIMIYTESYTDTSAFGMLQTIERRNAITKKYIPGPVEKSFMKVSDYFPPLNRRFEFQGQFASELRSYWDVEGYMMGGPFISYTFVDTAHQRLITLDGYIKAPKKNKRDLIIRLEALFSSFKYQEATQQK